MADNINLGSTQAPYWEQTITLKPNERRKIDYVTDNFQLKDASVPDVLRVNFGGSMIDTLFSSGMGYRMTEPVQFVELWNTGKVDLTIDFVVGIGAIQDNRLTVSGIVNTKGIPQGFSSIQGQTTTRSTPSTYNFQANSVLSAQCLSGEIQVQVYGGTDKYINSITLFPGQSFEINVAFSGELRFMPVSSSTYSWFIGGF